MKNTHGGVLLLVKLQDSVFARFLNCKNGTRSGKASYIEDKDFPRILPLHKIATATNFLSRDAIPHPYIIFIITPTEKLSKKT